MCLDIRNKVHLGAVRIIVFYAAAHVSVPRSNQRFRITVNHHRLPLTTTGAKIMTAFLQKLILHLITIGSKFLSIKLEPMQCCATRLLDIIKS